MLIVHLYSTLLPSETQQQKSGGYSKAALWTVNVHVQMVRLWRHSLILGIQNSMAHF